MLTGKGKFHIFFKIEKKSAMCVSTSQLILFAYFFNQFLFFEKLGSVNSSSKSNIFNIKVVFIDLFVLIRALYIHIRFWMPSDKKDNRPTSFRILSEHSADRSNPRPPNSFDTFLIIDWGQLEERVDEEARVRDSYSPDNNLFSSLIFFLIETELPHKI